MPKLEIDIKVEKEGPDRSYFDEARMEVSDTNDENVLQLRINYGPSVRIEKSEIERILRTFK